jgi:hypothetical protein
MLTEFRLCLHTLASLFGQAVKESLKTFHILDFLGSKGRVARWFKIFKPEIPMWVNFLGPYLDWKMLIYLMVILIFYEHLGYFMTIWYILCTFGNFFRFWYHVRRKIWQPSAVAQFNTYNGKKDWPLLSSVLSNTFFALFSNANKTKNHFKLVVCNLCRLHITDSLSVNLFSFKVLV